MKRIDPGSDCLTGKKQFATKRDAIDRATYLHHRKGSPLSAYRCQWCGCWHVGNRRTDNSKGRQRR